MSWLFSAVYLTNNQFFRAERASSLVSLEAI
jgi:hypothetical protein